MSIEQRGTSAAKHTRKWLGRTDQLHEAVKQAPAKAAKALHIEDSKLAAQAAHVTSWASDIHKVASYPTMLVQASQARNLSEVSIETTGCAIAVLGAAAASALSGSADSECRSFTADMPSEERDKLIGGTADVISAASLAVKCNPCTMMLSFSVGLLANAIDFLSGRRLSAARDKVKSKLEGSSEKLISSTEKLMNSLGSSDGGEREPLLPSSRQASAQSARRQTAPRSVQRTAPEKQAPRQRAQVCGCTQTHPDYVRGYQHGQVVGYDHGRRGEVGRAQDPARTAYNDGFAHGYRDGYNQGAAHWRQATVAQGQPNAVAQGYPVTQRSSGVHRGAEASMFAHGRAQQVVASSTGAPGAALHRETPLAMRR